MFNLNKCKIPTRYANMTRNARTGANRHGKSLLVLFLCPFLCPHCRPIPLHLSLPATTTTITDRIWQTPFALLTFDVPCSLSLTRYLLPLFYFSGDSLSLISIFASLSHTLLPSITDHPSLNFSFTGDRPLSLARMVLLSHLIRAELGQHTSMSDAELSPPKACPCWSDQHNTPTGVGIFAFLVIFILFLGRVGLSRAEPPCWFVPCLIRHAIPCAIVPWFDLCYGFVSSWLCGMSLSFTWVVTCRTCALLTGTGLERW
jgi:hypothetical protein